MVTKKITHVNSRAHARKINSVNKKVIKIKHLKNEKVKQNYVIDGHFAIVICI